VQLDAERLRDLRIFSGSELLEIGREAVRVIAEQLDSLDAALSSQDLDSVREAAHRARNEALAMGARDLADALGSVELAARARHHEDARDAVAATRELWPSTCEAIVRATQGATG
jgi:HPt (histidine-containing phosphotransfer) domain-containing protein